MRNNVKDQLPDVQSLSDDELRACVRRCNRAIEDGAPHIVAQTWRRAAIAEQRRRKRRSPKESNGQ